MQTGTIKLGDRVFPVAELPPVDHLKYRLWLMEQARRMYQPYDRLAAMLSGIEPELRAAVAGVAAAQIPVQPPSDFLQELELSVLGARALAWLMVPGITDEQVQTLITEANAVDVAVYLLDHRTPIFVRFEGSAIEQIAQINARRAEAGMVPIDAETGGQAE